MFNVSFKIYQRLKVLGPTKCKGDEDEEARTTHMVLRVGRDWNVQILTAPSLRGNGATLLSSRGAPCREQSQCLRLGKKKAGVLTCGSMPEAPVTL